MEDNKFNSVTKKKLVKYYVNKIINQSYNDSIYIYYESFLGGIDFMNFGTGHYQMILNEQVDIKHRDNNNDRVNRIKNHINIALENIDTYSNKIKNLNNSLENLKKNKNNLIDLITNSCNSFNSIKEFNFIDLKNKKENLSNLLNLFEENEKKINNLNEELKNIEKNIVICNNIISFNFN